MSEKQPEGAAIVREPDLPEPKEPEIPAHSRAARVWNTNNPGQRGTTYDGVTYECQPDGSMKALNKPMSRRKQQRLGLRPQRGGKGRE